MAKARDLSTHADMVVAKPKAVYTMSNDINDNRIFVYSRAIADGSLTALNSYSTGGKGNGMALGDQNGLIFDATQNLFFAVNAGDNTVSMMSLQSDGSLTMLAQAPSGGLVPKSVTVSGSTVYVVNAGKGTFAGNLAGFQISGGALSQINGSNQPLSGLTADPAQIQFTPNGSLLIVTEKGTNKIDTYPVVAGVAALPTFQASSGTTPYGFAFSAGQKLIVTEAAGGVAMMGTASSYSVGATGTLTPVSSKVASMQSSPCWVTVVGNIAYVVNAQSKNVTSYTVAADGSLTLVGNGSGVAAGMGATDVDATDNNDFLYVLNSKDSSFSIFSIATDGTLTKKPDFTGLPPTATGLVAR